MLEAKFQINRGGCNQIIGILIGTAPLVVAKKYWDKQISCTPYLFPSKFGIIFSNASSPRHFRVLSTSK